VEKGMAAKEKWSDERAPSTLIRKVIFFSEIKYLGIWLKSSHLLFLPLLCVMEG